MENENDDIQQNPSELPYEPWDTEAILREWPTADTGAVREPREFTKADWDPEQLRYCEHRVGIWAAQEEFIRERFGDSVEHVNYGWGSASNEEGQGEAAKIFVGNRVYILSSWSSYDAPAEVTHRLGEN